MVIFALKVSQGPLVQYNVALLPPMLWFHFGDQSAYGVVQGVEVGGISKGAPAKTLYAYWLLLVKPALFYCLVVG